MEGEAIDMFASAEGSYKVRLVLIKYPILPFGIVACTFFSDNLSRNSCI